MDDAAREYENEVEGWNKQICLFISNSLFKSVNKAVDELVVKEKRKEVLQELTLAVKNLLEERKYPQFIPK